MSYLFKKIGLGSCVISDHMPLVLFGGMVEASAFREVDLTGSLNVLSSFLFSSNSDVLNECIEILNTYIKQRLLNDSPKKVCLGVSIFAYLDY